jgi:hypothetical protein
MQEDLKGYIKRKRGLSDRISTSVGIEMAKQLKAFYRKIELIKGKMDLEAHQRKI